MTRSRGFLPEEPADQFAAVHARHVEIGQDEIDLVLAAGDGPLGGFAIFSRDDV